MRVQSAKQRRTRGNVQAALDAATNSDALVQALMDLLYSDASGADASARGLRQDLRRRLLPLYHRTAYKVPACRGGADALTPEWLASVMRITGEGDSV